MADDDVQLAEAPAKGSKLKLILLVVGGMLVAAGATVGGLFAAGIIPGQATTQAASAPAEEPIQEAIYVSLDPAFTVNFPETEGGVKYLQISLNAMTRNPDIETELTRHMPAIRNDLMLLFGSKASLELATKEGKDALQAETLAGIQQVLKRETGEPGVEAVYFTGFVMQ